ncbi:MAG TPA: beta-ketoacyl-ACP synthase II [Candidatus Pullichristensenella excrementigallinarum]|uniref:3-oxoacyl-[acyl-carrier-protein] synthase 2 n=1 Tax=Candidatus Pullichristensenella excrementigallinarum TaxID=2840907 RepID=A0A9D1ICQ3_9FIRM|nr:beta-ketoacyl-ACP synthase II [Candidatus Pullichristensenella excrementigallinarum]
MNRVVITGMGVISPVGNSTEAFFSNLLAGRSGICPISRFDTTEYKVKLAAEVQGFQPEDFGIEKGLARRCDLFTQYALAAAEQAVQESGILGTVPENRLGVYVGSGIGGMETFVNEAYKLRDRGPGRVSPFFVPMMIGNIASGNIAIRYGAKGPCLPVVTACATSSHAVGEAFRAIKHGYADAILAGGAEATVTPLAIAGFTNLKALSESEDPECASLPFDARRKGFVLGEGAGVLVLEEYEHARARGAKMYAELVGYGNTCDAHHITAPHPEGEGGMEAVRLAVEEAGGLPDASVYVNAHGTGTPLNDKVETLVLKRALGEERAREMLISSTKSMTGHMLGAAGAVEAVVCAKALETGELPPTIHLDCPDPECDLNYLPNQALHCQAEMALSLSLGFGGHNAVIAMRRIA